MNHAFESTSKDVIRFLHDASVFNEWSECRQSLIDLLSSDDPWIHSLPFLSCEAVGGDKSSVTPVATAWITLVHAANIIDDVQDGDTSRLVHFQSPKLALTIALAWIFAAFRMIDDISINSETRNEVTRIFSSAGFDSSLGQFQDGDMGQSASATDNQLEQYWNTTIFKSGSIFMAGMESGAAVGGGSEEVIEALGEYGTALGVIRQVIDDCRDAEMEKRLPGEHHALHMLLQSMVIDEKTTKSRNLGEVRKREDLIISQTPKLPVDIDLPEIIIDILFEWRRRALRSLSVLKTSEARTELEKIVDLAMMPKLHS